LLRTLHIRDFALIEALDVEFGPGLNCITGETGAGKSILVGALKLILGDRASTDVVRPGARKAVIEGTFALDADGATGRVVTAILEQNDIDILQELILRREVSGSQSRAFINDTPVTVTLLKDVASELVDLHGQHEHQSLLRTERHIPLVDAFGDLGDEVAAYRELLSEARDLADRRARLQSEKHALGREKDLLAFQIAEIDSVAPVEGEEDALEAERRVLENAERLFETTNQLSELMYDSDSAINDLLVRARNQLSELTRIDPAFNEIRQEIASAQISVAEAAAFLQDYNARIEFNPDRLEAIRERSIDLDRLKRKYGGTLEAVLLHRQEIGERFAMASDVDGALKKLDDAFHAVTDRLSAQAWRLSGLRREAADGIESLIVEELARLGMPESRFRVEFVQDVDPDGWIRSDKGTTFTAGARGVDRGGFLISTNPGMDIMPLARVASGGEISRIMLAMKSILARTDQLPILIFDEIDTGISGATAQKVADCMASLGESVQILAITHLPQVAAAGRFQFRVAKQVEDDVTRTLMTALDEGERIHEIAALLSGSTVTDAARASARELLKV
jgi:DNA repair protein RecN (Recombination protein N)